MHSFIRSMLSGVAPVFAMAMCAAACGPGTDARAPSAMPSASNTPDEPQRPAPPADAQVRCNQDSDCPSLACGPCDAGAPVMQMALQQECVVNPCGGVKTGCTKGLCVVR